MDRWLHDAPAFAYIKEVAMSVVVNSSGNPIALTADPEEMKWLFNWIVDSEKQQLKSGLNLRRELNDEEPPRSHSLAEYGRRRPAPELRYSTLEGHSGDRRSGNKTGSARRQLIGEEIGPKRVLQLRLFQNQQDAESWARQGIGRRLRLARIGSVGWTRALKEELKMFERAEAPSLSARLTRINQL